MQIGKKIQGLRQKTSDKDSVVKTIVFVMQEMGWSWNDTMDCPIPAFYEVVWALNEKQKEEKKHMDKAKHKVRNNGTT